MMEIRKLIFCAGILMAPAAVFGQMLEIAGSGGASLLRNNDLVSIPAQTPGGTPVAIKLTDGFRLGFRLGLNPYRFIGHEVGYAYNRTNLRYEQGSAAGTVEQGMAIHQGSYNLLLYAVPEGSPVRPFVAGGGHFANFVPPGASAGSGGGVTKFGLNFGGGVKARLAGMFMMRFDVRQYLTPKPDFFQVAPKGWLRQTEVSAGFGVGF